MPDQPARGAVLADWLALHGLAAPAALDLLDRFAADQGKVVSGNSPLALSAPEVWSMVAQAFGAGFGDNSALADRVMARTITEFAPDRTRFPRAFTLHDAGEGRPFVSCPFRSRLGDMLTLAHEFGHAAQILASEGRPLPPILRETCAFVSESWLLDHLKRHDPPLWSALQPVWQGQIAGYLGPDANVLRAALADPSSRYDYIWNYPLACGLARGMPKEQAAALFAASLTMPDLIRAL